MKALHILATFALVMGAVTAASPASAYWTHLIAQNHKMPTPAAANGSGSEIGSITAYGAPATLAMATSGRTLASISGSGSENHAAVTAFAARETGAQVAAVTVEPPIAGTLR